MKIKVQFVSLIVIIINIFKKWGKKEEKQIDISNKNDNKVELYGEASSYISVIKIHG